MHFLAFGAFFGAHLRARAPRFHRHATATAPENRAWVGYRTRSRYTCHHRATGPTAVRAASGQVHINPILNLFWIGDINRWKIP